jgi:hypothetical protein
MFFEVVATLAEDEAPELELVEETEVFGALFFEDFVLVSGVWRLWRPFSSSS